MSKRVLASSDYLRPSEPEPIRSEMTSSKDATISTWIVMPGQSIAPHIHPTGQDTWVVLSGEGQYLIDSQGTTQPIQAGDVVVAHAGEIHGVINNRNEPLSFVSLLSPPDAGLEFI